ncbi:hypothetical protein [Botrimarina mediterranea]|uniref:hypothetical protein n=1 Tax=Botrimarina mediterranea TaxID=2528022 RepID=UPI00118C07BC|nr:hypothetical protein K2D_39090 [Planctomycetes bacterium K2D]
MDRLDAKLDMLLKLGRLFGPLERLIEAPEDFNEQERAETLARYFSEFPKLNDECRKYSVGQAGHNYQIEFEKFFNALYGVFRQLQAGHELEKVVRNSVKDARDAIQAIPVPRSSVILEAGTPFTAFCKLRSLCEADAIRSLVWFDGYFGANIFHRYLQFVPDEVCVTLVAAEPGDRAGRPNRHRWEEFLDVSRLFAAEHGHDRYRLIIAKSLHDRWLVLDEKRIYAIGGSAKDAASTDYFTIASVEPTTANLQCIADTTSNGDEWFGPNSQSHR